MYQDALDPARIQVVNGDGGTLGWPATIGITAVEFSANPDEGQRFSFTDMPWGDVIPPGWSGPLEYTVWLFVQTSGGWVGSGIIQMWRRTDSGPSGKDRGWTGAPLLSHYRDWVYDGRWGAMNGVLVNVGDQIGLMVSAGNARPGRAATLERSNIVLCTLRPAPYIESFAVEPPPPPPDEPQEPPPPPPPSDQLLARLDAMDAKLTAIDAQLQRGFTAPILGKIKPTPPPSRTKKTRRAK